MKKKWLLLALLGVALIGIVIAVRLTSRMRSNVPWAPERAFDDELPKAGAVEAVEVVYDQKLGNGWEDWGWGPHELRAGAPARVGFAGYGGIVLHHRELPSQFGALVFRYKAPESFGEFLAVGLGRQKTEEERFPVVSVDRRKLAALPDGWRQATIKWSELNPSNLPVDRITISARSLVTADWVELDKIVLTKGSGAASSVLSIRDADLDILCSEKGHAIDPLVYGISHGGWESGETAHRIGGNPITRMNWEVGNIWNVGSDWFFENASAGKDGLFEWLEDGVRHDKPTALQVPMIGWVAKDATSVGFPLEKYGKQQKHDPNRPEAGNGYRPDGTPIKPGPPTHSLEATPEVIGRWIRDLRERDRVRGKRSVLMYILDNEPSLWNRAHRDVHPEPLGYDELLDRSVRYGTEIRKADPEIPIAGPAEWGWSGYFFSAKDREAGFQVQPDRRAHGGVALIPWYLRELAAHERSSGTRILDVLDVHFYPAAEGIFGPNPRIDQEGAALRLRQTRALWDSNYRDESWIKEPIRLIPRLREWVAENYPGRRVMLGEWNFGAESHISGGLAVAEALGRFGQQRLDAAFFYGEVKEGSPVFLAFRAFRNFDGKGARFEDWSVPTRGSDNVSLFASRNEKGTRLTAVLVNTDPNFAIRAKVDAGACGKLQKRRVYSFDSSSRTLAEEPAAALDGGEFSELVKPYSVKVVEIELNVTASH